MTNKELEKYVKDILKRLEALESRKVELKDELYSVKEFAEMMQVSIATAYNILKRNEIETIKLGTKKVRAKDIRRLLDEVPCA